MTDERTHDGKPAIVCTTDLSPESDYVIDRAIQLAKSLGCRRLYLLHVSEVVERFKPDHDPTERVEGEFARIEMQAQAHLDKVAHDTRARCELEIIPVLRAGSPYIEIVRFATEIHADMVVVGTHARTGLPRALLGSVAERVVRHAPCTVVVAKPRDLSARLVAGFGLPFHTSPE